MENLLKDELSRRGFITGMAKSCLGVSAILGAEDLLAYEIPVKLHLLVTLSFCIWQVE